MKVQDLIIDPKSLGEKFWLVDIIPSYEYKDNRRTDTVTGYRYVTCLVEKSLEKINIRIDGKQILEKPDNGYVEVKFTDLEVYIFWSGGLPQVGAKAANIQLVTNKT